MSQENDFAKPASNVPSNKCPECRSELKKEIKEKSHKYRRVTCPNCSYGYCKGLA